MPRHVWIGITCSVVCAGILGAQSTSPPPPSLVQPIIERYITAWKGFYPSAAFAAGDRGSAYFFEELSEQACQHWLGVNQDTLKRLGELPKKLSAADRIDSRLLERQAQFEIERWQEDQAQRHAPDFYADLISQALTYILARADGSSADKTMAVFARCRGIARLCAAGVNLLTDGRPDSSARSIETLQESANFMRAKLAGIVRAWSPQMRASEIEQKCQSAAAAIETLSEHIRRTVLPSATLPNALGKKAFTRKLAIYTYGQIAPDALQHMALDEIARVRDLMTQLAPECWRQTHAASDAAPNGQALLEWSLRAMEEDCAGNQRDFLQFFKKVAADCAVFVRGNDLASMPARLPMTIEASPAHFAGAAVGGVYPPGPFMPDADTLYFIPAIADAAPIAAKDNFYRSFNNRFCMMIMPHELYPGHALQLSLAARQPHVVRALFGDDCFIEGWGSLCEQLMLDNGWDNDKPLTRQAHLRKRLENAVRAYIAVMVHAHDWDRGKVLAFAEKEGLLAPQFASNLWNRVMDTPLQITSYFIGFKQLDDMLRLEQKKRGKHFLYKDFCNTVLDNGSIPLSELALILKSAR